MKIEKIYINKLNEYITFYIGTNQNDNFTIIDEGYEFDMWFHSVDTSSCHVVARIPTTTQKQQMKYIIKQGALLCKQHTNKLKNIQNVKIMYTQLKNVSKTNIIGMVNVVTHKQIII